MISQQYEEFFRKTGIRTPVELARPRLVPITKLLLPRNSAYHAPLNDDGAVGPSEFSEYFKGYERSLYLKMVEGGSAAKMMGVVSVRKVTLISDIQLFFRQHNQFNNIDRQRQAAAIQNNLMVYDYSLIHNRLNYRESYATAYLRWRNTFVTVLDTIDAAVKDKDRRQHFVEFVVPERLNAMSTWMLLSEDIATRKADMHGIKFRRELLTRMANDESRIFAELWLYAGNKRENEKGILSTYSAETLSRVNIILRAGNYFSVMNIGLLTSWLKRDSDDNSKERTLMPMVARKRLLVMLMCMNKARSLNGAEIEEESVEVDDGVDDAERAQKIVDAAKDSPDARKQIDVDMAKVKPGKHTVKIDQTVANSNSVPTTPIDNKGVVTLSKVELRQAEEVAESLDADVDKDLEQLEFLEKQQQVEDLYTQYTAYEPPSENPVEAAIEIAQEAAHKGQLTAAEFRRLANKAERFMNIANPFDTKDGTFAAGISYEAVDLQITDETRQILPSIPGVLDSTMLATSLNELNTGYVKKQLNKDIGHCVLNLQKCGIILDDYKVQDYEDINDAYQEHVFKFIPVRGEPSTCRVRIPKVGKDGTFKAGGVKYNMRRQRGDYPIHKVKPHEVSLTSYYSKMFVRRADRRVFNYEVWLSDNIRDRGVNPEDLSIQAMELADVSQRSYKGSRVYSALSKSFSSFVCGEWQFRLNAAEMESYFGKDYPKGYTPLARSTQTKAVLLVNNNNEAFTYGADKQLIPVGTIERILGINPNNAPVDMAEVGLFGKQLPLGFILAYQAGLGNFLETIKAKYRTVKRGSQLKLNDFEFAVRFEDESLIFDRRQKMVALLMSGFNRYHRDLKRYPRVMFDKRDVFGAVLDNNDISSRRLKECEVLFPLWVDPMTRDILEEMKMPTDLFNLFLKATELLTNDEWPEPLERDKGYERFAGFVYQELIKSLRGYQSKPNSSTAQVSMNPLSVWMNILQDQTVSPVDDANPYQALKDVEVVVYRGQGGRSTRSMTTESRKFAKRSMGVISEATVDNGDVGTIAYTSVNPNYNSLRGTTTELASLDETSKIFSTSTLMAAGATKDDPKRINFINIQNSQTTHAVSYHPMPVRTGYERIMAHRTPDLYASTAKQDGVVKELNDKNIVIEYADGTADAIELGRRFGKWSGKVIPHNVVTELKVGDKVKPGTVLAYNTHFFQRDTLDPNQVLYKPGVLARTVLWESTGTLEDSCGLSREFASKLGTSGTHIRYVRVNFNQEVTNLSKMKEKVEPESILCTLYEPVGAAMDIYEGEALNTLQDIGQLNPKAEYEGVVEKIEVLYCGEPEEMSDSLRALTDASDTRLYKQRKQMRLPAIDGRVDPGFRIDNTPMVDGTAVIAIYITGITGMGIGDKIVFSHQLKSVVGDIHKEAYVTEDGKAIDAEFGYLSLMNRIINSVFDVGTTNTLLIALTEAAVEAYDHGKQKG